MEHQQQQQYTDHHDKANKTKLSIVQCTTNNIKRKRQQQQQQPQQQQHKEKHKSAGNYLCDQMHKMSSLSSSSSSRAATTYQQHAKPLHYVTGLLSLLLLATLMPHRCLAQQQKFRVTPHDQQVLEGTEAMMRCEVANLAGAVQWTKDGFALGFSQVIPGFPRYSVMGDRKQGVYNLHIKNASIIDDAEYQCQVGPARLNSAIRANAKLTVISPPATIEIQGHSHNTKVEVHENQDLTLKCIVANAKPAAQIIWYRGNMEFRPDNNKDKVEETTTKRFTTTSSLKLKPGSDDDYTEYTCQAKHKALSPDMPMRTTVQLSVLYPPGPPYIEGYTQGETLRRGQNVELICRSRGGNPPAQLIWYKNGSQIRMAYRTSGRLSENIYSFTAEAIDNKARFRCEASNVMSQTPLKTEVELTVLFAPAHVTVTGPTEARVADVVPLTCTTAPSNPAAEVKWMVDGHQMRNASSKTTLSSEGGWITVSNLTTIIEPNKRSLVAICHGLNMQLTENVVSTHTVNVLYPPLPPLISGYVEGQIIPAGSVHQLACSSSGGNPLATLTWYKNDKRVNSVIKTGDKSVSAEITILANVTDNQAQYRCEATNSATEIPLIASKTLSVHFAPDTVKIHIEPEELRPGIEATIICDSSSSNPAAKLTWWKEGIAIERTTNISKPGLWGGTVSTLEFKVNITQEMNGIVYTCQSANEALQRSIHEAISLDVLYRPKFVPPPSSTAVGVEGESLSVSLQANANPKSIMYTWTRNGIVIPSNVGGSENGGDENGELPRIFSDDASLNFTKLHRNDAGIYMCEARNSQGSASLNLTVVVEYGTTIKGISENVIVNPGEDAMLSCSVEGKPLTDEHVKWERLGYDMTVKTSTTFVNGTSYLHIKNAQREDVGNFRCTADNRVTNPTNRDVLLIVKFAPEIDKSPTLLRAASGTGERGRLPCRAQSSPRPKFTWRQDGQDLQINRTHKYEVEEKKIDSLTYESTLIIEKVAPADYGAYECIAKNELGETVEKVRLDITSQPDTPLSLNILNATHDSVTVAWTPGFDGGLKASYRVRYREAHREQYKYIDGLPNSHKLSINGLKMNTLYLFSVMAYNDLGQSKYLPDLQRAQTKEAPPPSHPASSLGGSPPSTSSTPLGGTSGVLLLAGITAGITIVLLNIFIIGCCLHKRSQKRLKRGLDITPTEFKNYNDPPNMVILGVSLAVFGFLILNAALVAWFLLHLRRKKAETTNQPAKTASIEMYAPSSYNDTITGETLSSVSEKSESYSNEGSQPDYIDETRRKNATSTYLIDNTDISSLRYQKDGTLPAFYPNNLGNARTLPHPRHNNANSNSLMDHRARDDQLLINKTVYIPSPSPAPPPDGSYYNMNSDRYLSYPPMYTQDYIPQLEFAAPPMAMQPLQPLSQASVISSNAIIGPTATAVIGGANIGGSGGGTLRRGIMRGIIGVPPPDVTHHTTNMGSVQILHDMHATNLSNVIPTTLTTSPNSSGNILTTTSTPPTVKQPQSILKDPNRYKQQQQQQQQPQMLNSGLIGVPAAPTNLQILNIPTSSGLSNNLLMTTSVPFDPSNVQNMSTFNNATVTTLAYTDADGHLV